jgi:hypothetical protein
MGNSSNDYSPSVTGAGESICSRNPGSRTTSIDESKIVVLAVLTLYCSRLLSISAHVALIALRSPVGSYLSTAGFC